MHVDSGMCEIQWVILTIKLPGHLDFLAVLSRRLIVVLSSTLDSLTPVKANHIAIYSLLGDL